MWGRVWGMWHIESLCDVLLFTRGAVCAAEGEDVGCSC